MTSFMNGPKGHSDLCGLGNRHIDWMYDQPTVYTGNNIADGKKQCQIEGGKTLEMLGSWKAHLTGVGKPML